MHRLEVRWHGRGGQGAVTAAEILAEAAIKEGKYALAFPEYGAERRGAPVLAFTRIDEEPILEREPIMSPDIVVVLDPYLPPEVFMRGLKHNGYLVINTKRSLDETKQWLQQQGFTPPEHVAVVDATEIALKYLGVPIVNTAMIGALVRAVNVVSLTSVEETIFERFLERSRDLAEKNTRIVREAYDVTVVG